MSPQALADCFNAFVSVGDQVAYAEIIGDQRTLYRTRTEAYVLSGHTAVVMLEGKSGCVCISHCQPYPMTSDEPAPWEAEPEPPATPRLSRSKERYRRFQAADWFTGTFLEFCRHEDHKAKA